MGLNSSFKGLITRGMPICTALSVGLSVAASNSVFTFLLQVPIT